MKKVLHIISSPRRAASLSIKLGNAIVETITAQQPDTEVEEFNLIEKQFPHLEEAHLTSFFTPHEQRSPEQLAAVLHSDDAIEKIKNADILVIGAPLYNFGIHSTLKAWIDHIVRAGITFSYSEGGVQGLLKNKKVYIAIASGGIYSHGPAQALDFVEPYLRSILGFIGITDITVFRIEGTALPGNSETAIENGLNSVRTHWAVAQQDIME
ncbi:FMN-dependent NADH-azoreductase [Pedobacter panaciterrae]|uniref:FMN-dependent NADH-azoreductase n=1 Tax=Pedobacter panaciterrae TaxID=363849 RepID=UPI00259AC97C|nr:NAD(P)H-dependent oxidoreductase [uncultured Pedobacter sp.]